MNHKGLGFTDALYQQQDRASSMQHTDISVNNLPSMPAWSYSQQHLEYISIGISNGLASKWVGSGYMRVRARVRITRFLRRVLYVRTYLYIDEFCILLKVSIVDVVRTLPVYPCVHTKTMRPYVGRNLCALLHIYDRTYHQENI